MKISLLDYLACPGCQASLDCLYPVYEQGEIRSGTLKCQGCGEEYAVKNFIPRLLREGLARGKRDTAKAFGWEWNRFSEIHSLPDYKEQFLDWVHPLTPNAFEGKIILDAGCGMGRFAQVASSMGAREVLAVDLSESVEAAYKNTKHLKNVHVVQGDLYQLPFKKVDLIYSIGVLHHLPDPRQGFLSLVSHLKREGVISVWVYGLENNEWVVRWVNPIRKIFTSKLPPFFLYGISYLISLPLQGVLKLIYRPAAKARWKINLPYQAYLQWLSKYNFRHTHHVIFDHLVAPTAFYLKRDEFKQWFVGAGLRDVDISWRNNNSWRGYGRVNGVVQTPGN